MDLKKETFKKLDSSTHPDVVFATNTSSLPIIQIAVTTKRPDKVVGMHFFNPVPVMRLVEIIKTLATSDEVVQFAYDFSLALGKEPVKTKDVPGFIVNRILIPMLNESVFALEEEVGTAEDIDKAMKLGTNQPIGPLALIDLIGLDVTLNVMDTFYKEFQDSKFRAAPLLRAPRDHQAAGFLRVGKHWPVANLLHEERHPGGPALVAHRLGPARIERPRLRAGLAADYDPVETRPPQRSEEPAVMLEVHWPERRFIAHPPHRGRGLE